MNIYVNERPCELADGCNVTTALAALGIPAPNGTALAVNSNVIPRAEWHSHTLAPGDKVMIIKATQGG